MEPEKNSLYLIEFGLEDPYGKFFQIWETSLRLRERQMQACWTVSCDLLCCAEHRAGVRGLPGGPNVRGLLKLASFEDWVWWDFLKAEVIWVQVCGSSCENEKGGFQGAGNLLSYTSDQFKSPKFGSAFCLGYHKHTFRAVETSSYYRPSFWRRVMGRSWPWHKVRLKARIDSDSAFSRFRHQTAGVYQPLFSEPVHVGHNRIIGDSIPALTGSLSLLGSELN